MVDEFRVDVDDSVEVVEAFEFVGAAEFVVEGWVGEEFAVEEMSGGIGLRIVKNKQTNKKFLFRIRRASGYIIQYI